MLLVLLVLLLIATARSYRTTINSNINSNSNSNSNINININSNSNINIRTSTVLSLSSLTSSNFIFVTCQAGVEKIVKLEVASQYPDLRLAFSRKGLLTFKAPTELDDDVEISSIFTKHSGKSIGMTTVEEALALARTLSSDVYKTKLRLHVYGRDLGGQRTEHPLFIKERSQQIEDIKTKLYDDAIFLPRNHDDRSNEKDVVFNVIVGDVDEKLFCGLNLGKHTSNGYPGKIFPLKLPNEAPSRAWLKIEEAVKFIKVLYPDMAISPNEIAVEIGSAPGGACYSLLNTFGLKVYGVDPCPPDRQHDRIIKQNSNFNEIKGTLQSVTRAQLPRECHWLLCDANISPTEALSKLILMMNHYSGTLKGFFYTCKLNDEYWDKERELLKCLQEMRAGIKSEVKACEDVVFTQLAANRKEVLCFVKMAAFNM